MLQSVKKLLGLRNKIKKGFTLRIKGESQGKDVIMTKHFFSLKDAMTSLPKLHWELKALSSKNGEKIEAEEYPVFFSFSFDVPVMEDGVCRDVDVLIAEIVSGKKNVSNIQKKMKKG